MEKVLLIIMGLELQLFLSKFHYITLGLFLLVSFNCNLEQKKSIKEEYTDQTFELMNEPQKCRNEKSLRLMLNIPYSGGIEIYTFEEDSIRNKFFYSKKKVLIRNLVESEILSSERVILGVEKYKKDKIFTAYKEILNLVADNSLKYFNKTRKFETNNLSSFNTSYFMRIDFFENGKYKYYSFDKLEDDFNQILGKLP